MNHVEILQYLIDKYQFKSYLEIGVTGGLGHLKINCQTKESNDIVDYNPIFNVKYDITYLMPSDEMFAKMPIDRKYDLIFIDGMHDEDYVDRDIINALKHLNSNGFICLHDVIPLSSMSQTSYECFNSEMAWNGTVWKSITKLQNNNLEFYTVINDDSGLTIIKYKDNPYHLQLPNYKCNLRYEYIFTKNINPYNRLTEQGKYIMHAISEDEFLNKF
jgi:hypothetical protein